MPDDRAFYKSIASRSFERAYSIHGDEEFLKDAAVRQLLAAALDPATRDFNLDIRDASSVSAEELASLRATPHPCARMRERRWIIFSSGPRRRTRTSCSCSSSDRQTAGSPTDRCCSARFR